MHHRSTDTLPLQDLANALSGTRVLSGFTLKEINDPRPLGHSLHFTTLEGASFVYHSPADTIGEKDDNAHAFHALRSVLVDRISELGYAVTQHPNNPCVWLSGPRLGNLYLAGQQNTLLRSLLDALLLAVRMHVEGELSDALKPIGDEAGRMLRDLRCLEPFEVLSSPGWVWFISPTGMRRSFSTDFKLPGRESDEAAMAVLTEMLTDLMLKRADGVIFNVTPNGRHVVQLLDGTGEPMCTYTAPTRLEALAGVAQGLW